MDYVLSNMVFLSYRLVTINSYLQVGASLTQRLHKWASAFVPEFLAHLMDTLNSFHLCSIVNSEYKRSEIFDLIMPECCTKLLSNEVELLTMHYKLLIL